MLTASKVVTQRGLKRTRKKPTRTSYEYLDTAESLPAYDKVAVDTTSTVLKHVGELPSYAEIAIDTETTGLERDALLVGVSFCGEVGKAFWLPADFIDPKALQEALANKTLIMHNGKFDLQVLARNGVDLYSNRFNLNRQAEDYLTWYREILKVWRKGEGRR